MSLYDPNSATVPGYILHVTKEFAEAAVGGLGVVINSVARGQVLAGNMVGGVAFGIIAIFSAYRLIDAIGETFKPPVNPVGHEVV